MKTFLQFVRDEDGATAIEYSLLAALIAVALIAILGTVADAIEEVFQFISDELDAVTP